MIGRDQEDNKVSEKYGWKFTQGPIQRSYVWRRNKIDVEMLRCGSALYVSLIKLNASRTALVVELKSTNTKDLRIVLGLV